MLEVRNLSFSYRRREVLKNVSFVASPGETVSIVGVNGAGKTTLLKTLATLFVPDSGSILFDGHNAGEEPMKFRRQLGYLPEEPALYEDMTVRDYLDYRAQLKGEMEKRIRRRIDEALEMCRLKEVAKTTIKKLSYGLKKRVQLADALMLRPRVLLLDDFLSGLDRPMRLQVAEILKSAAAFSSVIATGHDIEDMAKWTTRFLILKDGIIEAEIPTSGVEPSALRERIDLVLKGSVK